MTGGETRFIGEAIEVEFREPPLYAKRPGCPDSFLWQGVSHRIVKVEREWHDYERRGRMARNMRPDHAAAAESRGSWGVGRDYFRVRTQENRVFDLYYDRAPGSGRRRRGAWTLFREVSPDGA